MKQLSIIAGACALIAGVWSAPVHAKGLQHPQHDPFFDTKQCVIVKQVRRVDQKVLEANRVCPKMYEMVDVFYPAQMGEREHTDRYGKSSLLKVKLRFFGQESEFLEGDGKRVRVWIEEMGPEGLKHEGNHTMVLAHGKPKWISTKSAVDLWLVVDQDPRPNTFDQEMESKMTKEQKGYMLQNAHGHHHAKPAGATRHQPGQSMGYPNANYYNPAHLHSGYSTHGGHNPWNPWAWEGMHVNERRAYLLNEIQSPKLAK